MKILVTGGAGFIGSHICKQLLDLNHQVVVYDNLSKGRLENLDKRSLFIQGDLSDKELLKKSLQGIDAVIHMAALIEVGESVKEPENFIKNNVLGSLYLLECMNEAGVKKIIFSSTASVYSIFAKSPLTEESLVQAGNPYGASKVAVENLLSAYNYTFGFDVTILRYFNAYGPGENHQPETHAIPNFIKSALKKEPIPLYWQGNQVRDFIYVEDLARAHTEVLNLSGFNVFNVGTEKGLKIKHVIKELEKILGYKLEINDLGERKGDVPECYASSKKLKHATKWRFRYSLKEGLEKTVKWFQSQSANPA